MSFVERLFKRSVLPVVLAMFGCAGSGGSSTSSSQASSVGASSGVAATSSSSGGGTTTQSLGTSTGAASSTGGSSSGGATSSGSSTGAPVLTFVDGGYVSCAMSFADDGGFDGGGGPANWLCPPGTYFCDLSGNIGNCFQCQSNQDCTNPQLPTYDRDRPYCDLTTGIAGYQNHCQECVANSDCSGNPAGQYCDLNPTYPVDSSQPSIEDLGFEHCGHLLTDCRVDGGPQCIGVNQFCDSNNGVCVTNPGTCSTDQDCLGLVSPYNPHLPEPFCVKGTCSSCATGFCPNTFCTMDANCGNPDSLPTGLICNPTTYLCSCTDSSQCGGFWPLCENLDGGQVDDAGQPLGNCGCDTAAECGDGGLICLSAGYPGAPTSCGLSCNSPEFPPCGLTASLPVCNPSTGNCGLCTEDDQCKKGMAIAGPICDYGSGGMGSCGCIYDTDCLAGQSCEAGPFLGSCVSSLSRCTPSSCSNYFCDWDSGTCLNNINVSAYPSCITDYDCTTTYSTANLCDNGRCIQCRSNADCVANGSAGNGSSVCCLAGDALCAALNIPNNTCADLCSTDQDCIGNYLGPSCVKGDAGYAAHCGCGSNLDCTGDVYGQHCDTDKADFGIGTCNCLSNSDCPPGDACQMFGGSPNGYCSSFCFGGDSGYPCAPNYFCDTAYGCRPRCDSDNTCQGKDQLCDTGNVAGQNGQTIDGAAPGVTWCYSCLQPSDCGAGLGCSPTHGCGDCTKSSDCPAGTACIDGGICQKTCVNGACANGEVCDTLGVAGYGPNICYQCLSAADCPGGEGCNHQSHTCGTCSGPTAVGGPFDCPPDAICSNYWTPQLTSTLGVCLANCDRQSCPTSEPICAVYPGLTPDHKFCFSCLQDSDCPDAGPNTHCNLSPNPTFTCVSDP